jgi:hypothetical protein
MPEPDPDCSELEHGEEARAEFVAASGQASEIFDFVEAALDQAAVLVKHLAEAVTLPAI